MSYLRFIASTRARIPLEYLKAGFLRLTKIPSYANDTYLQYTLKWLTLFGTWNTFSRTKVIYNFLTMLIIFVEFIYASSSVRYLLEHRNLSSNIYGLRVSIFVIGIILKQVIVIAKRDKIEEMIEILIQITNTTWSDYKHIEYKCELLGQMMTMNSQMIGVMASLFLMGPTFLSYWNGEPTELVIKVIYPFEQDLYKGFAQVFQLSSSVLAVGVAVSIGSLQIHFMLHLAGQLHILSLMVRSLHEKALKQYEDQLTIDIVDVDVDVEGMVALISNDSNETKSDRDEKVRDLSEVYLEECIQRHQKLYSLVRVFLDAFSAIFCIQMVVNGSAVAFVLYEISQASQFSTGMANSLVTLAMTVMDVALTCFLGSQIEAKSEEVARAAYYTDWLAMSSKFKLMVKIVIARAQNPICLHGCHMYKITNDTFFAMCKGSLSYYTFLVDMTNKKN